MAFNNIDGIESMCWKTLIGVDEFIPLETRKPAPTNSRKSRHFGQARVAGQKSSGLTRETFNRPFVDVATLPTLNYL
jgi:hypothetical protein